VSHQHFSDPGTAQSGVSRISARLKLAGALFLIVLVLLSRSPVFPVSLSLTCLLAAILGGIRPADYLRRFAEPAFIASVLVLIKAFTPEGDVLYSLSFAGFTPTLYEGGLVAGLHLAARIMGAVSLLVLLGMTTPFTRLLSALAWLRIPRTFVDILFFTYRYIFVLMDDAQVVYRAQKNRLGYAGLFRGLRSFGTLTGSVILRALDQSTATTTAMVQRGYTGRCHRSDLDRVRPADLILAILVLAAAAALYAFSEGIA